MATRPSILACLWLAVAAVTAAQDGSSSNPQQPTFRTGTQSVRVDLYATRDGKPVTDLRRDEIELFEDGVPQTIQTFERITFAAHTAMPPPEPRSLDESRQMAIDPRSRLFVLFVPTPTARRFASPLVRERFPLIPQLNALLGQDDLIAVMTPVMRIAELTFQRRLQLSNSAWFQEEYVHPKHALWDACYPPTLPGSPNAEMKARHQELMTFEALESLVTHLGGLREERKHVFVLTSGFRLFTRNPNLGMQMRPAGAPGGGPAPIGIVPRLGDSVGGARPRECEADLLDLAFLDHSNRLDEIAALARRNNVSFYPISPGLNTSTGRQSVVVGSTTIGTSLGIHSALRGLADETDGIAIVNTNNVEGNLRRIMTTTSAYYLLSYAPTNTAADGRFRRITVKVSRSSTRVRARPGYVAATPEELRPVGPVETSRPQDPVSSALNALARTITGMLHLRSASWMRSSDSGAPAGALWIVAELDEQIRNKGPWSKGGSAEITLQPAGGGAAITRRVDVAAASPVVEFELFDAADRLVPGSYSVQLKFVAADGEPLGTSARLTMPADPAPLGEPVLSRRTSAPGRRYTRTADSRFRRNEFVRLELPTTSLEPASARLLDSKGGSLPVPAQVTQRPDASGTFQWIVVDLPISPLAPAFYAIEVTQGGASRITAFRVVP